MEILFGIILAIAWHIRSSKYKHYDDEDWKKIKDDWVNWEDKGE